MPLVPSNLSLKMLEAIRLGENQLDPAGYPVWIESRMVTGYFPALEMKRLISERDDLSYLGKVNRNADRGDIPGFSFVREGGESLNEYIRVIQAKEKEKAAVGAAAG